MTANAAPSAKPYLQIQGLVKKFGDNYVAGPYRPRYRAARNLRPLAARAAANPLLRMLAGMEIAQSGQNHSRRY